MTKKQKKQLARIVSAAVLFLLAAALPLSPAVEMAAFLLCYALIGWDIVWKAVTNILHGQVFDENFLMTVATVGALCLNEYSEGVAVMLFYQVGEWFQSYAVNKVPPFHQQPDGYQAGFRQRNPQRRHRTSGP